MWVTRCPAMTTLPRCPGRAVPGQWLGPWSIVLSDSPWYSRRLEPEARDREVPDRDERLVEVLLGRWPARVGSASLRPPPSTAGAGGGGSVVVVGGRAVGSGPAVVGVGVADLDTSTAQAPSPARRGRANASTAATEPRRVVASRLMRFTATRLAAACRPWRMHAGMPMPAVGGAGDGDAGEVLGDIGLDGGDPVEVAGLVLRERRRASG